MTPAEAAAWLRHGGEHVAGMLDTLDRGMRPALYPEDVEAIRTLVELAERPSFPPVAGRCPACGWHSLILGSGGYVTCSIVECPDPTAASRLLGGNA